MVICEVTQQELWGKSEIYVEFYLGILMKGN